MAAYTIQVLPVFNDPVRLGGYGIQEEHGVFGELGALKTDFGGEGGGVGRGIVDRAIENGTELNAPLSVEDDTVDRVRVVARGYAIKNNVSDSKLTEKRLTARLGGYYSGEPENLVITLKLLG